MGVQRGLPCLSGVKFSALNIQPSKQLLHMSHPPAPLISAVSGYWAACTIRSQ